MPLRTRSTFPGIWPALSAAMAVSGLAAAQQQEPVPSAAAVGAAEEATAVTGSSPPSADSVTAVPVLVIGREQLAASGVPTIGELLQQLPQEGGALNSQVNQGGDGQTQMNLRNIGSQRTLVLVDGKRVVHGGVGAGTAVDLNSIPTASVERVEIILGGGSTVYGSDAIGGVVNVITRKRMSGVEVNGYTGFSQHSGANTYDVNLVAGAASDRGSVLLTAGYFDQQPLLASGRGWAANSVSYDFINQQENTFGSPTTPDTRVLGLDPGSCPTRLCQELAAAFGTGTRLNLIYDPRQRKPGATYVEGWRLRDAAIDVYNYQAENYLVTPSRRVSLFGNGEYRITDFARAWLQASYVQRESRYQIAPEPFTTGFDFTVSKNNPYNPFGVDLNAVQRRLTEIGPRGSAFDVNTTRIVAGVDGTFGPIVGWSWEAWINYGRSAGSSTSTGFLNTQKTGPGLGPGYIDANGAHCGAPGALIENCTPINLFGGPGSIDPNMAEQLGAYSGTNTGTTQLFQVGVNLSGQLGKIAADRPAVFAIGLEHRNEYGTLVYEPILAAGWNSDTGVPAPADIHGGFYSNEGYAELRVPVISHVPLAENVEVQLAARFYSYSTSGADWTYSLGARWSPIRDLTLRGTYSTAFRAPGISELFLGQTFGLENTGDPCADTHGDVALAERCRRAPGRAGGSGAGDNGYIVAMIFTLNGGNPLLQPEKATIGTFGAVFEPQAARGLSLAIDFHSISMDGLVGAYGAHGILNRCYGAEGVAQDISFCRFVTRDPATGRLQLVADTNANVASLVTSGIDLGARYTLPTGLGRFTLRFDGTYLLTYDYTDPDGLVIHGAGNYDGTGSANVVGSGVSASGSGNFNPRVKFNAGLSYELDRFGAGLIAHFIGPLTECAPFGGGVAAAGRFVGFCYQQARPDYSQPPGPGNEPYAPHHVSAQLTLDVQVGYKLSWPAGTTSLALGVRNLLDQAPPRIYNSFITYADPSYDFVGRFFYGRLEHKF